ncbi:VENN motif-containing pre-toxin protein [Scandinavium goeteborgense]|uniref:VENN motif-containing pre-toxin protein n=1 Tax=Scandinavium goeteborgense TaxID=1851514 RepID=A0A4R6E2N3_SCAGO|nr:VENN motif-containing pre-toxin protein [Scandinavium goeteborgense]
MANALVAGGGNKGHEEGTTQAAVADGTIAIHNKDDQQQDVADLSRDTEHANDSISPIFDKEKEQNRLKEIGLIGGQAADVARTQGDLMGRDAQKDPKSLEEARQQLAAEGKPATDAAVSERAYNNASSLYGTGGGVQRGIQAVTGALTALASGGNLAGALAGASAPELANIIGHHSGLSEQETLIAHAILGGAVASLQGNNAAAGAAGAVSGELVARAIKDQLFPDTDNRDLSESDKQLISNLATIASGLAGNLTGGDSSSTTAGAQAGKNAVENNALGHDDEEIEREHGDRLPKIQDITHLGPLLDEDGNPIPGTAGVGIGGVPIGRGSNAQNSTSCLNLKKSLASETQLSELSKSGGLPVAGAGTNTKLRVADSLAKEYGGKASDWSKVTSSSYKAEDGTIFEIHAYRNTVTGQLVEPKTIPLKK